MPNPLPHGHDPSIKNSPDPRHVLRRFQSPRNLPAISENSPPEFDQYKANLSNNEYTHNLRVHSFRILSNHIRKHVILIAPPRPHIPPLLIMSPLACSKAFVAETLGHPVLAVVLVASEWRFLG